MEKIIRQRIPASVRTLLTDIAPKEEELRDWTEPELDPVTKDGISLPVPAVSEDLLNPSGSGAADRTCGLCLTKPSCYTCPRCNVPYCGLACYRSPAHCSCSEEFYKECVTEELKCWSQTEEEGKTKMQEILLRLRNSADADGGMENVLKDVVESSGESVTEKDVEALELLSRLAELQSRKEEESEEVEEILQKLKEMEEGKEEDEEEEDLAQKMSGLDIDSLTEEQLWNLLPSQDKEKFEQLLKGGGFAGLVAPWRPWWEKHEQNVKTLVEEVELENEKEEIKKEEMKNKVGENSEDQEQMKEEKKDSVSEKAPTTQQQTHTTKHQSQPKQELKKVKKKSKTKSLDSSRPSISAKIPPLRTISSSPSPLVQFSVVNTLYGYAFSLCLFNGDISESEQLLDFCQLVLEVSESLGSGRVFSSFSEAIDGGILAVSATGHFDKDDPDAPVRAVEAVAHILTGQNKNDPTGYVLSALSQLRSAFSKARACITKEEEKEDWRRRFFLAGKKCEFFQSWVNENTDAVKSAARCTWRQYSKKRDEREMLEKEKKRLEEGQKRGRGRTLIEEI